MSLPKTSEPTSTITPATSPDDHRAAVENLRSSKIYEVRDILPPGGSVRDQEVIDTADRLGIALVFSTHRYFLH